MNVFVASTLQDSLARLDAQSQAAAKQAVYDYLSDSTRPGLQKHRLDSAKDKGFWSIRVSRDVRIIIHERGDSGVLCYVDHHDKAYQWAERRKLEVHPQTGAAQFVTIDERVEVRVKTVVQEVQEEPAVFRNHDRDYLLDLGVPPEWLDYVRGIGVSKLSSLIDLLPEEAAERLLDLAEGRPVPRPIRVDSADPFAHPDAQRRFRVVDSTSELKTALNAPWEKWTVFLHPTQRGAVEKTYAGPAKVSGGAGTGKTVVALHRAAWLAKNRPDARVLLTSYSTTLAARLNRSASLLLDGPPRERLVIVNLNKLASDIWRRTHGHGFSIASTEDIRRAIQDALRRSPASVFSAEFLRTEWESVVQPNGVSTWESYRTVSRTGRGTSLGAVQREAAWAVLSHVAESLRASGMVTWDQICHDVARHLRGAPTERFHYVVADEVQDFGLSELGLLRALVTEGPDDLFLCGDVGQRIYRSRSPWSAAGINVRGRSTRLRLNYRTTEQIQRVADRFLANSLEDNDGEFEERDTRSLLKGPGPLIVGNRDKGEELAGLAAWLQDLRQEGFSPGEIGVFARSESILNETVVPAIERAGMEAVSLRDEAELPAHAVAVATMHRAKGLEFKAVAVVGCSNGVLPNPLALRNTDGQGELDAARERERNLLYVAFSRARERLRISFVGAPSEFLTSANLLKADAR